MASSYGNTYGGNAYGGSLGNMSSAQRAQHVNQNWYAVGQRAPSQFTRPGNTPRGYGGSGGGGGNNQGGPPGSPEALAAQYQEQLDAANQANETRYQDILGQYGEAYDRNMGYINANTGQAQTDIRERATQSNAINDADLVNRGLRNSTLAANQRAGVQRELSSELRRETDQALQQRLGVDYGMSKDRMDFMERKNEIAPNYDQMIALMNSLGASGDGMSGQTGGSSVAQNLYSSLSGLGNIGMYFPGAQLGQSVPGMTFYK